MFSLLEQLLPARTELRLVLSPHPVPVIVDRTQLERVVLNLVVDGRDAIEGTGTITVSTAKSAPAGPRARRPRPAGWLQVRDTGSGLPEAVQPHIFDPSFTTKSPESGTGLGLAMIYGIVRQSGGGDGPRRFPRRCGDDPDRRVLVDSRVGAGTTLTVALPAGSAHT